MTDWSRGFGRVWKGERRVEVRCQPVALTKTNISATVVERYGYSSFIICTSIFNHNSNKDIASVALISETLRLHVNLVLKFLRMTNPITIRPLFDGSIVIEVGS